MATSLPLPNRADRLLPFVFAGALACAGGPAPSPASPVEVPAVAREAEALPPTGPAFAIYTARRTLVVPIAGGAPIAEAAGIWVLDDATAPPQVQALFVAPPEGLLPCDGERASERPCGADPVPYEDGAICDCIDAPADAAEYEEACWSMYTSPTSLVGGRLYALGSSNNTCEGVNVYDAVGADHAMVAAPFAPASFAPLLSPRGCTVDVPAGEPAPASEHDRLECAGPGQAPRPGAPEPCEDCELLTPEVETWVLTRGRLARVEDNIFHAGGARWVSDLRVAPSRCPSTADTCGPIALYPGIADAEGFWIATDGSAALTLDRQGVRVLRPGGRAHAAFDVRDRAIIGVRFHRDARALVAAIHDGAPRSAVR